MEMLGSSLTCAELCQIGPRPGWPQYGGHIVPCLGLSECCLFCLSRNIWCLANLTAASVLCGAGPGSLPCGMRGIMSERTTGLADRLPPWRRVLLCPFSMGISCPIRGSAVLCLPCWAWHQDTMIRGIWTSSSVGGTGMVMQPEPSPRTDDWCRHSPLLGLTTSALHSAPHESEERHCPLTVLEVACVSTLK